MTSLLDAADLELLTLAVASLPDVWQDEGRTLLQKITTYIAKGELTLLDPPPPVVPCTCERSFHMSIASFARDD